MTTEELKEVTPRLKALTPPPRMAALIFAPHVPREQNPHYADYGRFPNFYA